MTFNRRQFGIFATALLASSVAVGADFGNKVKTPKISMTGEELAQWAQARGLATATFGNGCFWCTEAVFQRVRGVERVVSGYSGGHVKNPTYEQVCSKLTGHAECCQIFYDPQQVSYDELLEIFWKTHDPTTKNRQGNDVGPQYRSVIFYHSDEQRQKAEHYKQKLDEAKVFPRKIVTEIAEFKEFFPAEDYHQNYYNLNPNQGYCAYVVREKVEKFKQVFPEKVKPEAR